jgi:hypothetical protein
MENDPLLTDEFDAYDEEEDEEIALDRASRQVEDDDVWADGDDEDAV